MKTQENQSEERVSNRQVLINATLDAIAEIGLIRTSVSEIIERAGLSRGMIHLHFNGKPNLIVEAARYASEQYYQILHENIQGAESNPARLIEAIVRGDLGPKSLNTRNVSIWYEFRGAARNDAGIAAYSDTRDAGLRDLLRDAAFALAEREGASDPAAIARDMSFGLMALLEGMWTDFMLHPQSFDRQMAERIMFRYLSGTWPNSFDVSGVISP